MTDKIYKPLSEWEPKKGDVFENKNGERLACVSDTHARYDYWAPERTEIFRWFCVSRYTLISRAADLTQAGCPDRRGV